MNIDEMISKLNDPRLKKAITDLSQSPKGKEVLKKLDKIDKSKLEGYIKSVNSSNVSSEILLKQIQGNPQLLDKLNQLLSKM